MEVPLTNVHFNAKVPEKWGKNLMSIRALFFRYYCK
jgi:hypothetical protein